MGSLVFVLFGCAASHADVAPASWGRLQQACGTFTKVRFGVEFVLPGVDHTHDRALVHVSSTGAVGVDRGSTRWAWTAQAGLSEDSRNAGGPTVRYTPGSAVSEEIGEPLDACRGGLSGWSWSNLSEQSVFPAGMEDYTGSAAGQVGPGCGEVGAPDGLLGSSRVFVCFGETTLVPEVVAAVSASGAVYYAQIVALNWNSAFPDAALWAAAPPLGLRPPRPLEWIDSDASISAMRARPRVPTPLPGEAAQVADTEPPPDPAKCYSEAAELIPCP